MDFIDSADTRYQLTETAETPAPAKKQVVWPWVVGGLAVVGGLVWMASQTSRKTNPVDSETEALIVEARDPDTEWDRLWELVKHPKAEVRRALLDNPNLCPTDDDGKFDARLLQILAEELPDEVAEHPMFVLHALIEPNDEFEWVVMEVVQRTKNVGLIERLFSLHGTYSEDVCRKIAVNPNTPLHLLESLANSRDSYTQQCVARNLSTSKEILIALSESESYYVRDYVAKHSNTPVEVLRHLGDSCREPQPSVRISVIENPNTPEEVLQYLGDEETEPHWNVRTTAVLMLRKRKISR